MGGERRKVYELPMCLFSLLYSERMGKGFRTVEVKRLGGRRKRLLVFGMRAGKDCVFWDGDCAFLQKDEIFETLVYSLPSYISHTPSHIHPLSQDALQYKDSCQFQLNGHPWLEDPARL